MTPSRSCPGCGHASLRRNGSRDVLAPRLEGERVEWVRIDLVRMNCPACGYAKTVGADRVEALQEALSAFLVERVAREGVARAASAAAMTSPTVTKWVARACDAALADPFPEAIRIRADGPLVLFEAPDVGAVLDVQRLDGSGVADCLARRGADVTEVGIGLDLRLRDAVRDACPDAEIHLLHGEAIPRLDGALAASVSRRVPEAVMLRDVMQGSGWTEARLDVLGRIAACNAMTGLSTLLGLWADELRACLARPRDGPPDAALPPRPDFLRVRACIACAEKPGPTPGEISALLAATLLTDTQP